MFNDLRFAMRGLRATPVFTALAVLTLALGIGASAAVFTLAENIFQRGLAFDQPGQVYRLSAEDLDRGASQFPWSEAKFRFFREHQTTFSSFGADVFAGYSLTGTGDPELVNGQRVTANLLSLLGIRPLRGRLFREDEEESGPYVVIISESFWTRRLARDPDVIGRTLIFDDLPYEIVGVIADPPVTVFGNSEVWTTRPFTFPGYTEELRARGVGFIRVWARLSEERSVEQARSHIADLTAQYEQAFPEKVDVTFTNAMQSLDDETVGNLKPAFWMLIGAVALVLLIASSNVANLLLVRFSSRRREVAVRLALGSARGRVVRLFLMESLTVSALAILVGLLFAQLALRLFTDLLTGVPVTGELEVNPAVFMATMAVGVFTGLITGLYPAFQAARSNVVDAMKEGGRTATISRGQHRFRAVMVGAQVALSCVLLIGALLLLTSFQKLRAVDLGFDTENVLIAALNLPQSRYADAAHQQVVVDQLLESLRSQPGIADATAVSGAPMTGGVQGPFTGTSPEIPYPDRPLGHFRYISDHYLSTLGSELLDGRVFDGSDFANPSQVVMINETLAKVVFQDEPAVGRFLLVGSRGGNGDRVEVVGVVRDMRTVSVSDPPAPEIYEPYSQRIGAGGFVQLLVRSASPDATATLPGIRAALADLDPNLPLIQPQAMADLVGGAIAQQRLMVTLLVAFAGIAVILAVIGLYSVLAYLVGQRANEIGVRLALGAQRAEVTRLIWRQGMTPVVAGIVVGLLAAAGLGRLVEAQLFGTTPTDPVSYAVTSISLLLAAACACLIPAWRGSRQALNSLLR